MADNFQTVAYELDWDSEIKNDSSFVLLPEGEYPFTVKAVERGHFDGSAKMPPCKMVTATLEINGGMRGTATVTQRLYLINTQEWKLCQFFLSLGMRKNGEPLRMNFPATIGKSGRCKLKVRTYTNRNGDEKESNEVAEFLPPEAPSDAPIQQTWASGKF